MPVSRDWVLLATAGVMSACASQAGTGSFASNAGVLGCADVVAWGTVTATTAVDEGLEVTFDVDQWVYPSTGADSVTFLADDPSREVAAPAWPESGERLLAVVSDTAPTQRLDAAQGEQAVLQWRDAGSPRLTEEECDRA